MLSRPPVRGETHAIIRMVDDLPAPFGPRNPNDSPRATSRSMPFDRLDIGSGLHREALAKRARNDHRIGVLDPVGRDRAADAEPATANRSGRPTRPFTLTDATPGRRQRIDH